jgi:hypothetical protein
MLKLLLLNCSQFFLKHIIHLVFRKGYKKVTFKRENFQL